MRIKRTAVAFLVVPVLFLFAGVVGLKMTSRSVVWSYTEEGSVSRLPIFVLFNPFRDKAVESASEEALKSIRNGRCKEVVRGLRRSDRYRSLCENLKSDSIIDWKMVFREDRSNDVTVFYKTKRASSETFDDEIGITFNSENRRSWRLTDIGTIY
ncbi:MAG: hypothetical protein R2684_12635 [Pyrinomonadaceae bacterium]